MLMTWGERKVHLFFLSFYIYISLETRSVMCWRMREREKFALFVYSMRSKSIEKVIKLTHGLIFIH